MGNGAKKKRRRSISNDAAAKVGFDGGSAFSCMAFVIMGLGVKFSMASVGVRFVRLLCISFDLG